MASTELRAAAQQALEALTPFVRGSWTPGLAVQAAAAMDRLKAALAEPVQEHDLSRCPKCNGPADNGHDREVPPNPYYCTKCMAEPVAWLTPGQDLHLNNGEGFRFSDWTPLYTAPPQRKPLSDADLAKIWDDALDQLDPRDQLRFIARAIERAHGIGGQP